MAFLPLHSGGVGKDRTVAIGACFARGADRDCDGVATVTGCLLFDNPRGSWSIDCQCLKNVRRAGNGEYAPGT
jgi:hypothetical protein